MDDMFLQCNKNTIYVLNSNSAFRYGEFDMIGLFGSPAGRALTRSPSLNDKSQGSTTPPLNSNNITKIHSTLNANAAVNNDKPSRSGNETELNKRKHFMFKTNIRKTKLWKFFDDDSSNNTSRNNNTNSSKSNNNHSSSHNNNIKKNSIEDLSTGSFSQNSYTKKRIKNNQKSSKELYREAATLLGLSCSLSDNCRCLDCQSRYFDCDDSDSYSDISNLEISDRNQDTTLINNFVDGADVDVNGLNVGAGDEYDYDNDGDDNYMEDRRLGGEETNDRVVNEIYQKEYIQNCSLYEFNNDDIIA